MLPSPRLAEDLVPGGEEPGGHNATHVPEPDEADLWEIALRPSQARASIAAMSSSSS
jgi:hypothetical protein